MRYAVGADVGGTNVRVGLIDETGRILARKSEAVGEMRDPLPFLDRLSRLIREVAGSRFDPLAGVGLGLPGICDTKAGVIHQLPHFPSWRDVPVLKILSEKFDCPVYFDNDANMAALGEMWLGAAKDLDFFVMLTLGTGIGGGIVLNRKLWRGEQGFAGEVGHMVIEVGGRPCTCGNKGCWEMYASSGAVPKGTTGQELALKAAKKDLGALKFWKEFGSYLGLGISNLANITGVEHFVVGGGIANAFPHFIEPTKKTIQKGSYVRMAEKIVVASSVLGGNSALLGSVSHFF